MTENKDDDDSRKSKTTNSDAMASQPNGDLNDLPDEVTVPESSESRSVRSRITASSKSTSTRTRRESERLRSEIERLRNTRDRLRRNATTFKKRSSFGSRNEVTHQSQNGNNNSPAPRNVNHSHGDHNSHDSTFTKSTHSSTRRENERLRLENGRIRSELAELQRNFEALLQSLETKGVPNAAPVQNIVEVEAFQPADREELLGTQVEHLTKLVQALQIDNEDLRFQVEKLSGVPEASEGNVTTSSTIVQPSLWKKHWSKILLGGVVLVVAGAVAYLYWPVTYAGRVVRISKAIVRLHGTYSIPGTITRTNQVINWVSQNGVGLPEDEIF